MKIELIDEERAALRRAINAAYLVKLDGMGKYYGMYTDQDKAEANAELDLWKLLQEKLK